MKTLQSVRLENFQSHEDTFIEFDPATTLIRGENQAGKTAILRALALTLTNDSFPDHYLSHWANDCTITLVLSDGSKIERCFGKKKQVVLYEPHALKGTEYKGIKDCADIVRDFTGFKKVQLNKTDKTGESLQIIRVRDGHFLINDSAETVWRKLSAVTSGNGLETAKINIKKKLDGIRAESKVLARQYAEGLEALTIVETKHSSTLAALHASIKEREERLAEIEEIVEVYEAYKKNVKLYTEESELLADVTTALTEIESDIELYDSKNKTLLELTRVLGQLEKDITSRDKETKELQVLEQSLLEITAELKEFTCDKCNRVVEVLG